MNLLDYAKELERRADRMYDLADLVRLYAEQATESMVDSVEPDTARTIKILMKDEPKYDF